MHTHHSMPVVRGFVFAFVPALALWALIIGALAYALH
jgi:hypothetical protein